MPRRVPLLSLCLLLATAGAARAGETACWFENGAVIVPAVIADMAGDYVVDLSAPRTLLHETKAQMAGIIEPEPSLPVQIAGLRIPAVSVKVAESEYPPADAPLRICVALLVTVFSSCP